MNKKSILLHTFCLVVLGNILPLKAQERDLTYEEQIKAFTTDERFYPASIAQIIDHPTIPSPLKHFGTIIGAPGVMHNTSEIYGYYQALAAASDRLMIQQMGTSEEGRAIHLVMISNETTLANADSYKAMLAELADPRKTPSDRAEELIKNGKSVYYLNGGMHSTEMGSPEMLMELAYRLLTDDSEAIKHIRENVIVLINPVSEPDGRDKQVDWYHRYTKFRSEWDDGFPRSTPYWGKYVFHDNNRDGLQITQAITKNIFKIYYDWHPNVMLDLHESVPLLYISTGTGPYNENVDPITVGEWQTIANYEMTSLAAQGLPGVFHWAFYDGWWPGYGVWVANTHNSVGRFYETFGNAGANTYLRDLTKSKYAGDNVTSREWYRPDPASGMVNWSARNNTNYMQAGVLASLTYAADNREGLLKNFYQKGVNNTRFAEKNKIKQFTIPAAQRDPSMAAYLVNQLRAQGIEVHQVVEGEAVGSYLIKLDQPYSKLAYDLLTEQNYPKEAKFPPYDAIAWTLSMLYGVDVEKNEAFTHSPAELELITEEVRYEAKATGEATNYVLDYNAQSKTLSALYALKQYSKNAKAYTSDLSFTVANDTLSEGSIVFSGLTASQAQKLATDFELDLKATQTVPSDLRAISLPKVAVFHSWTDTQAEGWVRFTLEQRQIPYTSIDKDDLKSGKLRSKFDVIVIPHQRGDATSFIHGVSNSFGPMPFTKTATFQAHGTPDSSEDITGGPGFDGIHQLSAFVEAGGILIPLDNSSTIVAELGIGKQLSRQNTSKLFHPGSIVTAKARQSKSPLLYGYPEKFHLYKGNTPLLKTALRDRHYMVLQYGDDPQSDETPYEGAIMGLPEDQQPKATEKSKDKARKYVRSGMVRNENEIVGHGALFNVPHGKGSVISFTFNPLNRFLNHHDSGLFWNALIHWNHLN
ncbi:MAG: M14 family zinc carboxypeptidase [Flavobacteriaceae bacterium]